MSDDFNPYSQWLGIPPYEQPPNHYRLLDIDLFESDAIVIAASADQRMAQVRSAHLGERAKATQQLLAEISAARVCLLESKQRAAYDARLRAAMKSALPNSPLLAPVIPPLPGDVDGSNVTRARRPGAGPASASIPRATASPTGSAASAASAASPAAAATGGRTGVPLRRFLMVAISAVTAACALVIVVRHLGRGTPQEQFDGPPPIELSDDNNQSLAGKTVIVPEKTVVQGDDGNIELAAADALIEAAESHGEPLLRWMPGLKLAQWNFLVRKPGIFMIEVTYAAAGEAAGGRAQISVNDRNVTFHVRDTGGWDTFVTDPTKMVAIRRSGRYALVVEPHEATGETIMHLKSIRLRRAAVGGSSR